MDGKTGSNIPPIFEETLERLEELIEENEKNFETNLNRIKELRNSKSFAGRRVKGMIRRFCLNFFQPEFLRQEEINTIVVNMEQDLHRLQNHGMERAYLKGQIDLLKYQNSVNLSSGLNGKLISVMADLMNHPLYERNRQRSCVIQIVSSLNFGDAVGNDVLAIQRALKEDDFLTAIYAKSISPRIKEEDVYDLELLPELHAEDIVIYHFASADPYAEEIKNLPCKVVLRYHNITPPEFFHGFDKGTESITTAGKAQIEALAPYVDYGMIVSEFNSRDLREMGYTCPMEVVPILIPFSDYEQTPDEGVLKKYRDGKTNIVFVGRGAPNKKIEDVIAGFAEYKKDYDSDARLFLVGNYDVKGSYYKYLMERIEELGVSDVIFPGHITFKEILAYYKIANVFLCMSEHEGFCVPLVEAMFFSVPIVAYSSTAVPDTLGGTGILLESKDAHEVASAVHRVISDKEFAKKLVEQETNRLKDFQYEVIKENMLGFLKKIADE